MATLKQRLHRKNSSGTYDTIHLETGADCITGTLGVAHGGTGVTSISALKNALGLNGSLITARYYPSCGAQQFALKTTDYTGDWIDDGIVIDLSTVTPILIFTDSYYRQYDNYNYMPDGFYKIIYTNGSGAIPYVDANSDIMFIYQGSDYNRIFYKFEYVNKTVRGYYRMSNNKSNVSFTFRGCGITVISI